MRAVATKPLLAVDGRVFDHADAVMTGLLTGAWQACERRLAEALAQDAAGATGVTEDALSGVLREFRRERRLLSSEDLRAWLADRDLTGDDLVSWARRQLLGNATGGGPAAPPGAVSAVLRAEAVLGGTLAACAEALAERAVARRALGQRAPDPDEAAARRLAAEALDGPDRGLEPSSMLERARLAVSLDAAMEAFARESAEPGALERRLRARRLELTRVRMETLALASEDAAREAVLCVRADGMALAQVAARAGTACSVHDGEVGAVAGVLRGAAAGAAPGELLGPLADDDGFHVAVVRDRRAPALGDPEIRARLTRELTARRLGRESAGRVEWHGHV